MTLPIRLRTPALMSDAELMRFCAANDELRVERTVDGEIVITSPAGFDTSKMNQRIGRLLDEWAEADGRGVVTDSSGGYLLPDGSMMAPDAAWVAQARVNALSEAEQKRAVRGGTKEICAFVSRFCHRTAVALRQPCGA